MTAMKDAFEMRDLGFQNLDLLGIKIDIADSYVGVSLQRP